MLASLAATCRCKQWHIGITTKRLLAADAPSQGVCYSLEKSFSPPEVEAFLRVTGDTNSIHFDAAAAVRLGEAAYHCLQGLDGPILPGILCASLFPTIIAKHFPGTIYLSQSLKFRKFARVGDKLLAQVTAQNIKGQHVKFQTQCFDGQGSTLIDGEALAKLSL